jgi:hypothetical protein
MILKKCHEQSCYGCRFALEARNHVRLGEQVRCAKAEELFGGERWVNVRKGKTGDILKSKCGEFQPFVGDDSTAPDPKPQPKVMAVCDSCKGSGKLIIQFAHSREAMKCYKCKGKGKVELQ